MFEKFLQEKFFENYHGDKEHFEDDFDNWLETLDGNDYIQYGNEAMTQNSAKILGSLTSKKKEASSKKNGKLGGRPRKQNETETKSKG